MGKQLASAGINTSVLILPGIYTRVENGSASGVSYLHPHIPRMYKFWEHAVVDTLSIIDFLDQKKLWENLEFVKDQTELWNCRPNKSEKLLVKLLQKLFPNEWKYVGDASFWLKIDGKLINPDFININGQKKIIELFGDYWHGEERTGVSNEQHEQERVNLLSQFGYETLVVWEHELDNENKLKEKLLQFS